jgi:hypothetical protein
MALKIPTSSIARPSKIYPKLDFWFENIPSGITEVLFSAKQQVSEIFAAHFSRNDQGDQIGRIFAYCFTFWQVFENYTSSPNFKATFSTAKVMY